MNIAIQRVTGQSKTLPEASAAITWSNLADQIPQIQSVCSIRNSAQMIRMARPSSNEPLSVHGSKTNANIFQCMGKRLPFPSGLFDCSWEIGRNPTAVDPIFKHPMSRLVLFSVANNFAGFGSIPVGKVLKFLKEQNAVSLLRHLEAVQGPAADALAENLFKSALEGGDLRTIQALLRQGIDPNIHTSFGYAALEISSCIGDLAITECLLSYGADPNINLEDRDIFDYRRYLCRLYESWRTQCPLNPNIVQALLRRGLKVTARVMCAFLRDPHILDLLEMFQDRLQDYDLNDWIENGILQEILINMENLNATALIAAILEHWDPNTPQSKRAQMQLTEALDRAADEGCLGIVQNLLRYTKLSSHSLSYAVRSKSMDLVGFLLNIGASVQAPEIFDSDESRWSSRSESDRLSDERNIALDDRKCRPWKSVSSPLGEALLARNDELQHLLIERGALNNLVKNFFHRGSEKYDENDKPPFHTILEAATEAGNVSVFQRLLVSFLDVDLGLEPDSYEASSARLRHFRHALSIAVRSGQDLITMMLLDAGIIRYLPNVELVQHSLRSRNSQLFWKAVRCQAPYSYRQRAGHGSCIQEALEWGDPRILEGLMQWSGDLSMLGIESAAITAIEQENIDRLQLYMRLGADLKELPHHDSSPKPKNLPIKMPVEFKSPMLAAVQARSERSVKFLLFHGVGCDDSSALLEAVCEVHPFIPVLLGAFRQKWPNGKPGFGVEALREAIKQQNHGVIASLLEAHVETNVEINCYIDDPGDIKEQTPLRLAIKQCTGANVALVEQLLQASGYTDNSMNSCGKIDDVLLQAIHENKLAVVKLLLRYGARVDHKASGYLPRTPLLMHATK